MNCSQHPHRPAESVCSLCASPICGDCQVTLGNQVYCRSCVEKGLHVKPLGRYQKTVSESKSRFLAFILSLVPGVGYMYLGLMKRGLQTLVAFFGSIFVGQLIGLESISALVIPVLMFYSVFDTQQLVRKVNAGEWVEDANLFDVDWFQIDLNWVGYGLIILGVLALLHNLMPLLLPTYVFRVILAPFAIIALGVYILYRHSKQ